MAVADKANQIQIGLEQNQRDENTFNELAHADAKHDFDKIKVRNIVEMVKYPLNSKISSPQHALNKTKTRESDGDENIYDFFKGKLNTVLPVDKVPSDKILKEEDVMEIIGLDYPSEIRIPLNNIAADQKGVVLLGDKKGEAKKEFIFKDKNGNSIKDKNGNSIKRIYEVKAVRFRLGKTERIPVAQAFEAVSGGKKEFNLIVDAANISTSDLRIFNKDALKDGDETITPLAGQTNGPFTFRFLKSIENDSDSATKIENFEKITDPDDENKVKVYFLKDENNVGYFPTFKDPNPAANVFSDVQFETRRIGEKVLGSFQVEPNKNYEIDDLSKSSDRQQASKLAMHKYIENRGSIDSDVSIQKEIALHILSKRIGDWCQAICLLDKAREYSSYELQFEENGKYKYKDVEEDKKVKLIDFPEAETAILTLDQILLAYSILLGVNVFFTIKTANPAPGGAGWLIYFKNTLSGGVTKKQIDDTKKDLDSRLESLDEYTKTGHTDIVEAIKKKAPSSKEPNLLEYLKKIYAILYGLTELTPKEEFESLKTQIKDLQSKVKDLQSKEPTENAVDWYVSSKFIIKKAEQLIADNKKQSSLEMPGNLEKSINDVLKHVKDGKSLVCTTVFMRFIEEIIKPFRERYLIIDSEYGEEITNLLVAIENYNESFLNIIQTGRGRVPNTLNNMREIRIKINSIFNPKKILSGGAIRKSDPKAYKEQLEESFNKIRQRRIIFANTKSNLNKLLEEYKDNTKGFEEKIKEIKGGDYFIGLKGDYVEDRHGNYISIIDQYIVTPDDCDIFITETGQICEILEKLFTSEYQEGDENLILGVNNRVLSSPSHIQKEKQGKKLVNSLDFFKEKYLNLRWKLLFTDILYTRLKNIQNRISTIMDELGDDYEESKKYQNVGETYEDILKIANDDQDLFLEKNHSDLFNEMKVILEYLKKINGDFNRNKNKGDSSTLRERLERKTKKEEKKEPMIAKLLRFTGVIRDRIINEYYYASVVMFEKGQGRSYNYQKALLYIEKQEASEYLASFSEKDKKYILDDNKKEQEAQESLIKELDKVFESDNTATATAAGVQGGSRKKRKTRRKSQRIKTTRRKCRNAV